MQNYKKKTFFVKIKLIFGKDGDEFIIDGVKFCRKIHRKKCKETIFKMVGTRFSDETFMPPEFMEYMKINFGLKDCDKIVLTRHLY